jgi:hypothetical protein
LIRDVEIDYRQPWVRKHVGTLYQAYRGTAHWESIIPQLQSVYEQEHRYLADLNVAHITRIGQILELDCEYYRASERVDSEARKTAMIVRVCQAFESQRYLTGLGSSLDFLEPELLRAAGIELGYQKFQLPDYEHPSGVHLDGMSVVDILCCLGPEEVREILLQQEGSYDSIRDIRKGKARI